MGAFINQGGFMTTNRSLKFCVDPGVCCARWMRAILCGARWRTCAEWSQPVMVGKIVTVMPRYECRLVQSGRPFNRSEGGGYVSQNP